DARLAGKAPRQAEKALRQGLHRGGRALVHYAGALRRGELIALQVQPAAPGRLSQPVALDAARLRAPRRGEDRRHEADQAALLPQHEADQSHADRAQRAAAGLCVALALLASTPVYATSEVLDG